MCHRSISLPYRRKISGKFYCEEFNRSSVYIRHGHFDNLVISNDIALCLLAIFGASVSYLLANMTITISNDICHNSTYKVCYFYIELSLSALCDNMIKVLRPYTVY